MREHTNIGKKIGSYLLLCCMVLTACMKDDKDVTPSSECYISNFSLQSVTQKRTTIGSDGQDSTYSVNMDGSFFPMIIDHRKQTIENKDSLPYNSVVEQILTNVEFSGIALSYREADSDSAQWKAFSTKDSINFARPLQFSVTAQDGSYRIYTVRLHVHQQEGDSLYWHCVDSLVEPLHGMTECKAVALENQLLVFGNSSNGAKLAIRQGLGTQASWQLHDATYPDGVNLSTLQARNQTLYLNDSDGQLYESQDGFVWNALGTPQAGMRLVAVSTQYFYATKDGKLYRSENAEEWREEELDEDASLLPQEHWLSVQYIQDNGNHRLFLTGSSLDEQPKSLSWAKSWRSNQVEQETIWMFFTPSTENVYTFPLLEHQVLFHYDGRLMTFGGNRLDREGKPMDCLYVSQDNGITWKKDLQLHLPFPLYGIPIETLSATVDQNQYIWIISNQQVWRGRLNRLGFEKQ